MPIITGGAEQLPKKQTVNLPDLQDPYTGLDKMPIRPTLATEIPNNSPAVIEGFDDLPPEEQEKIKGRYRYMGIRLRPDLRDQPVPIQRQTMEI